MRRWLLAPLLAATVARPASADTYRLRGDAFLYTQSPQQTVGYLTVTGEDKLNRWVDAETVVYGGTNGNADALVVLLRVHDPKNRFMLRLGRQIFTAGALRPIHIDGADASVRLPTKTTFEVFGGVPVPLMFQYQNQKYDWVVGGRVAQPLGRDTTAGFSYMQQRAEGKIAYEEIGADFASSPTKWFDLSSHAAYDLVNPGLTEVRASLSARLGPLRPELYATHRSPSRLLPATSLFSALGDAPSDAFGATVLWKAFPRLDFLPMVAARVQDGEGGVDATIRSTLRLDDQGAGALMLDLRRQGAGVDRWTGARFAARLPVRRTIIVSSELELVVPDTPNGRGSFWPWGLLGVAWRPGHRWEIAGAVEMASTPRSRAEMNALVRLSKSWGGP